jgi:hypothetical protein
LLQSQAAYLRQCGEFAKNNIIENEDFRRQYFSKQLELLSILSKDWGDRVAQEHQVILGFTPFDDIKHTWKKFSK